MEKNVFTGLKEYFDTYSDQEVLVLHGYEVMDLDSLERRDRFGKLKRSAQKEEKDFIVINLTYGYILTIEAKSTLDSKSIKKAKKQLENTKKLMKKWFGADLNKEWLFFSAIYCEKGDKYAKLCNNCDWRFIFTGLKDLLEKLENLHKIILSPKQVSQYNIHIHPTTHTKETHLCFHFEHNGEEKSGGLFVFFPKM